MRRDLANKRMLPFLLLVTLCGSGAYAQLTLDQCQTKAASNYPLIKQYDLISKSTEYTISNANKAWLPQISLTGIGAYIFKGLPSVKLPGQPASEEQKAQFIGVGTVNQVLWDGGATKTQKEIITAQSDVEKASIDVAMHQVKERVNEVYFGILLIDEQVNQLNVLTESVQRNLNAVTLSKNNGLAYQTDVDELKAELMKMDQRKVEYNYSRKGFTEMLGYLIGQPLAADVQLGAPVLSDTLPSVLSRPELKLYDQQQRLNSASYGMHKVANMPKFGLLGAGIMIQPGTAFGGTTLKSLAIGGISVSWSPNELFKGSNYRQLDKIQSDRITSQRETFLFSTNLQLMQMKSEIDKQQELLRKDSELVDLRTRIQGAYQLKYESGMASMNDLIGAMNRNNEARSTQALHHVLWLKAIQSYQTASGN